MGERCEVCGKQVEMMSQRGTGVCSRNCEKKRKTPKTKKSKRKKGKQRA